MSKLQAVRGMNDVLPPESATWQRLEEIAVETFAAFGFGEIRLPLLEPTELFRRAIGEDTDIVEKEMYTFADRNGDSLTLRPEGTAGSVRAGLQHGLFHNQTQRLWYRGPMFRHERPQRGRYRQFHQIGAEAFGFAGPDIDAEMLLLTHALLSRLGVGGLTLELNTLGSSAERRAFRDDLHKYLAGHRESLDDDSRRRLDRNPLRILDSKDPGTQAVVANAPRLADHLGEESRAHFSGLTGLLDAVGLPYTVNPYLVRGLDYYSRTVFEWTTDVLGAQGTVCAGGRYDALVEQAGGRPTPALGFAMGVERLIELMHTAGVSVPARLHVYLLAVADADFASVLELAGTLRRIPGLQVETHCGGGGMKARFRRADRSGAEFAVVVGGEEAAAGQVIVKPLRSGELQYPLAASELATHFAAAAGTTAGGAV